VAEFVRDLLLHHIELDYQLLIARHPMYHGVSHVLQVLRLLLAHLDLALCLLLQLQRELPAASDALSAEGEALVHLFKGTLVVIKAVVTAASALVVHNVKLFIQERVEAYLSILESLVKEVEYLIVHVTHCVLIILFRETEEVP
jgi:hypothetical protein